MLVRHVLYQLSYAPQFVPAFADGLLIILEVFPVVNSELRIFGVFFDETRAAQRAALDIPREW